MRTFSGRTAIVLLFLCLTSLLHARELAPLQRMSQEERIVRSTYRKLAVLNRAAREYEAGDQTEALLDGVAVKFTVRDFKIGPIHEILGSVHTDLVTGSTDEVLYTRKNLTIVSGGEELVSYAVEWVPGRYGSLADRRWSVAGVFATEAERYYDVGTYASYEVTASYDGRSRTYRALALFHDLYEGAARPDFWDNVAGMGGVLTDVWQEARPAYSMDAIRRAKNVPAVSDPAPGTAHRITTDDTTGPTFNWRAVNALGHDNGGYHFGQASFTGTCTELDASRQRCGVNIAGPTFGEVDDRTFGMYHVGTSTTKTTANTGLRGTSVQCDAAVGIGFNACLTPYCGVTISLTVSGSGASATATVTGADLWNAGHAEGWSCNIAKPAGCQYEGDPHGETQYGGSTPLPENEQICESTPIVIDVRGDGYALTSAAGGVAFDLDSNGAAEGLSWTAAGSDDAFLVLDRNGNGTIDDGRELFGNYTPQPRTSRPNGFLALAELDATRDGLVDARDAQFAALRLWTDRNHDGYSQSDELQTLDAAGLTALHLEYKESKKTDEHGNRFGYRAKVDDTHGTGVGRWAWDVILVRQ